MIKFKCVLARFLGVIHMNESKENNAVIGRNSEKLTLQRCLESHKPEFVALYGRRRIGKTYLVRQFFKGKFAFYTTGIKDGKKKDKLGIFNDALIAYGSGKKARPESWFEAFSRLRDLLESPKCYKDGKTGKKVVFLDELPWMDTPHSEFKSALDYFWNTYGSAQEDLLLIVCGSATSWIINNIAKDTGGFYNRLTNIIHLQPFSLNECRKLAEKLGLDHGEESVAKTYMVFGGVPFYWNLLYPEESLDQGVQRLCFEEGGPLRYEFETLFSSLFSAKRTHRQIILALSEKASGLTRQELLKRDGLKGGETLTKDLEELEQCGFVRKFKRPGAANGAYYQIKDPFVRFAITFLRSDKISSWLSYIKTPSYYSWQGNAFELLCLNHVKEIKNALGISGVETNEYSFRSSKHSPGAQIDLVIDRNDSVSNLCEMKYTTKPFAIDKDYAENLANKEEAYRLDTKTKNAVRITLISAHGVVRNSYSYVAMNVVTLSDFFK